MTSIIISIILNLVLGNPAEVTKEQDKTNNSNTTVNSDKKSDSISTMGGSGTWTSIEK